MHMQVKGHDVEDDVELIRTLLSHGAQIAELRLNQLYPASQLPFVREVIADTGSSSPNGPYLRTYLPTYLLAYVPTCLRTYLPTYLLAYFIFAYLPTCLLA